MHTIDIFYPQMVLYAQAIMQSKYILYLSLVSAFVGSALLPSNAFAQTSCLTINNGGPTTQQVCITPAPQKPAIVPPVASNTAPQQTKGGQRIYPASNTKATPSTGPEDWVLPGLAFLGALGFLLRNKTQTNLKRY